MPAAVPVIAEPLWFGPKDRPLCGWFHSPSGDGRGAGPARAGVVLCPPLGIEAICVYFTYRTLADRLAEAGFGVLRFDYDGTGDSAGSQDDPCRVSAWRDSVRHAVDLMVNGGATRTVLVGIRMGALLAAQEAHRRGGVDALVLWDPCLSGSAFLREHRALLMVGLGGEAKSDGSLEVPGIRFAPETVSELKTLDFAGLTGPLAKRTLVLSHPEGRALRSLARRLEGSPTDWEDATGQAALLDSHRQKTPHETIERVTDWVDTTFTGSAAQSIELPKAASAVVARSFGGQEVTERFARLGPLGLFGIVTEGPTSLAGGMRRPTVVFVNEGNTPHIGQSRMWVDLARSWAEHGVRSVRWDLSGNADSPARPGQEKHQIRAIEHADDVREVRQSVSPEDPSDVVLVGLCSGAYQALEAALTEPPRGIAILNPSLAFIPRERPVDASRRARQATRTWFIRLNRRALRWIARRRPDADGERWVSALEDGTWPSAVHRRLGSVPEGVWRVVIRACTTNPSAPLLNGLVENGPELLMVCGEEDLLPIELGERHVIKRLRDIPNFRLEVLPGLDHAGLVVEQRQRMMDKVSAWMLSRFGPTSLETPSERER